MQNLPPLRGKIRERAELAATNWFRVGGPAEWLFRPEDAEDLAAFLAAWEGPVMVIGVGSNLIVRDGGIEGAVVRLGRGFTEWSVQGTQLRLGAGMLCAQAAELAAAHGIGGLEFLVGIPGTVGGALAMNAGAYGREVKDVLARATRLRRDGSTETLGVADMSFSYRKSATPAGAVYIEAVFAGQPSAETPIRARMKEITTNREASQPVRARTGGSTFKNPEGEKAWALIDAAGCRGLTIGGAQMSEKHCNFMINTGAATAAELEALGEEVRRRVRAHSGVELQWEIQRIGRATTAAEA